MSAAAHAPPQPSHVSGHGKQQAIPIPQVLTVPTYAKDYRPDFKQPSVCERRAGAVARLRPVSGGWRRGCCCVVAAAGSGPGPAWRRPGTLAAPSPASQTYVRWRHTQRSDFHVEYDLDNEDVRFLENYNRGQQRLTADKMELMIWKVTKRAADGQAQAGGHS